MSVGRAALSVSPAQREWRDNGNLDQARAILAGVKNMPAYRQLSWGDLITFAGTVGIKASGGPADKFCFGRVDAPDGSKSIELGVEGVTECVGSECKTDAVCATNFHHAGQDKNDDPRCNLTQANGRLQVRVLELPLAAVRKDNVRHRYLPAEHSVIVLASRAGEPLRRSDL